MPIFEYQCEKCQFKFELLILFSNKKTDISCPNCKGKEITKLFSSFGFSSGKKITSSSSSGCNTCTTKQCGSCRG